MKSQSGFTLIEVLIAIAVFSIGILAMQTMQGISINSNTESSGISKKSSFASSQIENIINLDYDNVLLDDVDDDGDATNNDGDPNIQDTNLDGIDDDDDGNVNTMNFDEEFGLRHWQCCPGGVDPRGIPVANCGVGFPNSRVADQCAFFEDYDIYWNIAVGIPSENTKTINIIVVDPGDQFDPNRMPELRAEYTYVKDDLI